MNRRKHIEKKKQSSNEGVMRRVSKTEMAEFENTLQLVQRFSRPKMIREGNNKKLWIKTDAVHQFKS